MKERQVGEPVTDGNNIKVPDTKYNDYSKNKSEAYEDEIIDAFKLILNSGRNCYYNRQYYHAFSSVKVTFEVYRLMDSNTKSKIRDDPFNRYWIVDLCCKIINKHDYNSSEAREIISENNLYIKTCPNCNYVYPPDYSHCINCGNEMKTLKKTPEEIEGEIHAIIKNTIPNTHFIHQLVERSIILMKSNDCRLVKIENRLSSHQFIFEKEHKYFKTIYNCNFIPNESSGIFKDCKITHDYDKLFKNKTFWKLIKNTETKTGFRFKNCAGGYGSQTDNNGNDFIFNDNVCVYVGFNMDNNQIAVYDLDLDNMQLSKDYSILK